MRNLHLLLRRFAGLLGMLFGGAQAAAARKALKEINAARYASRIVSDGVLMNDIPSPSEAEELRMDFIARRLGEFGVSNVFADDSGNVLAMFPAFGTRKDFVLLTADVGDGGYSPLANSVRLSGDRAIGRGLGEYSLGAAALLVFAEFAQLTGFHLDKNLLLCFTRSSTVDEREESFRRFLDVWADRISCGILVKGIGLGVVETQHAGTYRLSIHVASEDRDMLEPGPHPSAASLLSSLAAKVGDISWPPDVRANISIARMEAGSGFGHWATKGEMDIEIVAEDDKYLEVLKSEVTKTIEESAAGSLTKIDTLVRFQKSAGDPQRNATLIDAVRGALGQVRVKPESGYVSDKVSLLNVRGIPAVAVGITREAGDGPEGVELDPIAAGFRQLLLVVEGTSAIAGTMED
jgi:hypothetical protein